MVLRGVFAAGVAAAAVLAAIQIVSSAALAGLASPASIPGALRGHASALVERVDPAWPMPATLRLVLARRELANGALERAQRLEALLPASPERTDLAAHLAEARGSSTDAVAEYLAAGDTDGVERYEATLESRGDYPAALHLQLALVARLGRDRTQAAAQAFALWRLGQLYETIAYHAPYQSYALIRARGQADALAAYERAAALSPLTERYLLAVANQGINVGDLDLASSTFARVRELDPAGLDGIVGSGDVARLRGDRRSAEAFLARAERLDPRAPEVRRLRRKLFGGAAPGTP